MSARTVGMVDLRRILADLPEKLEGGVLRGAMKAGAEVIATDARANCRSPEVRESIVTSASAKGRVVTAVIQTKGDGAYMAPWLEYGTDAHLIRAKGSTISKAEVRRANRKGGLMIGGAFVGQVVNHPGAKPYPFLRPALDQREDEAVAVIGEEIAARLGKLGSGA